jgi:hypothetical protein
MEFRHLIAQWSVCMPIDKVLTMQNQVFFKGKEEVKKKQMHLAFIMIKNAK